MENNTFPSIVVLGRSGSGKSTLLNNLAGENNIFEVGHELYSKTDDFQQEICRIFNGNQVNLWDTIGFHDNNNQSTEIFEKISKFYLEIRDILMIIYTWPIDRIRIDYESFVMAMDFFGKESFDYIFIVFTQDDYYDQNHKNNLKNEVLENLKKKYGIVLNHEKFYTNFENLQTGIRNHLEDASYRNKLFNYSVSAEIRKKKAKKSYKILKYFYGEKTYLDALVEVAKEKVENKELIRTLSNYYSILRGHYELLEKIQIKNNVEVTFIKNFEEIDKKLGYLIKKHMVLNKFLDKKKEPDDLNYIFNDNNNDDSSKNINNDDKTENKQENLLNNDDSSKDLNNNDKNENMVSNDEVSNQASTVNNISNEYENKDELIYYTF